MPNIEVDQKFFNDVIADRNRLIKALQGVLHHNDAVKPQYQLPPSLVRQVREAVNAAAEVVRQ